MNPTVDKPYGASRASILLAQIIEELPDPTRRTVRRWWGTTFSDYCHMMIDLLDLKANRNFHRHLVYEHFVCMVDAYKPEREDLQKVRTFALNVLKAQYMRECSEEVPENLRLRKRYTQEQRDAAERRKRVST